MNLESLCSPYCNKDKVVALLNDSREEFRRGVADMCMAFNLKVELLRGTIHTPNDVNLVTPNGWIAGRLMHIRDNSISTDDTKTYFKFVAPTINKPKGDGRSDRGSRAATKIKDLIKVLRMKKEVGSEDDLFKLQKSGIRFAINNLDHHVSRAPTPEVTLHYDVAEIVIRAALGETALPEINRSELVTAYEQYREKVAEYIESRDVLNRFNRSSHIIGIHNETENPQYFVGRASFDRTKMGGLEITVQSPVKRYVSLSETEVATDAAIIRTYMQSKDVHDNTNELGMPRRDMFFSDIDVSIGYASGTMLWVVFPARD